jgi:hypothetical protein
MIGRTCGTIEWVGTGRTAELCLPIPPVVTVHATFIAHGDRLRRNYGSGCSVGIGWDAPAFTSGRITTHHPLKLWPFALYAAFPRSDYYDHADSRHTHLGIWDGFPRPYFRSRYHRVKGLPCSQ